MNPTHMPIIPNLSSKLFTVFAICGLLILALIWSMS